MTGPPGRARPAGANWKPPRPTRGSAAASAAVVETLSLSLSGSLSKLKLNHDHRDSGRDQTQSHGQSHDLWHDSDDDDNNDQPISSGHPYPFASFTHWSYTRDMITYGTQNRTGHPGYPALQLHLTNH